MKVINGQAYIENEKHDLNELLDIVSILRGPEGCPWDKAQTHESLKECFLNETKEVLEAIDHKDDENLCEELGDVLFQVLLHAQIAKERGIFDFADVVQVLSEKMIRRHPHVFMDMKTPETEEESLKIWQQVKQKEKEMKKNKITKQMTIRLNVKKLYLLKGVP